MRKILGIFLLLLLISQPIQVSAHSGRTDKDGCHTESKTGKYHCHNKKTKEAKKEARTEARNGAR